MLNNINNINEPYRGLLEFSGLIEESYKHNGCYVLTDFGKNYEEKVRESLGKGFMTMTTHVGSTMSMMSIILNPTILEGVFDDYLRNPQTFYRILAPTIGINYVGNLTTSIGVSNQQILIPTPISEHILLRKALRDLNCKIIKPSYTVLNLTTMRQSNCAKIPSIFSSIQYRTLL